MLRVAFAGAFATRLEPSVRVHLGALAEAAGIDVEIISSDDEAEILPRLGEIDALVSLGFTQEMGAAGRHLRLVQVPGTGIDKIDLAAIPPGTWLANAYGHEVGIAEYVLGAMLAWNHRFERLDGSLRQGRWISPWVPDAPPPPLRPVLSGKTLGILGYGRIGREMARRARAFGMRVWATRRDVSQTDPSEVDVLGGPGDLDRLLQAADFLAVTLGLSAETRGLLGARELGLMKPTAVIVNVARAEILDETALYEALAEERIGGAVLDVWYQYPTSGEPTFPSRLPFHELPNVVMTPHISGWTEATLDARACLIAENIVRAARGEPPENLIPHDENAHV
jgi:phosphoglycerate dehydrogenase-like enzyme